MSSVVCYGHASSQFATSSSTRVPTGTRMKQSDLRAREMTHSMHVTLTSQTKPSFVVPVWLEYRSFLNFKYIIFKSGAFYYSMSTSREDRHVVLRYGGTVH